MAWREPETDIMHYWKHNNPQSRKMLRTPVDGTHLSAKDFARRLVEERGLVVVLGRQASVV